MECQLCPLVFARHTRHQVRHKFANAPGMVNSQWFRTLVRLWARVAKVSNMELERMLALLKQAAPVSSKNQPPDAERFCAAGFLTQLATDHRLRGRCDPRFLMREQLAKNGTPINSSPRPGRYSRAASNFSLFQADCSKKAEGEGRKSYSEYCDQRKEIHRAWGAMSAERKAEYTAKAKRKFQETQEHSELEPQQSDSSQVGYQTLFEGASDRDFPFTPEAFARVVRGEAGERSKLPGFTKYMKSFRERFVDNIFIPDAGH